MQKWAWLGWAWFLLPDLRVIGSEGQMAPLPIGRDEWPVTEKMALDPSPKEERGSSQA